jgi:pimeloyl-ACP methyl ester carboxylesterase
MTTTSGSHRLYKSEASFQVMQEFYDKSLAALPVVTESRYVQTRFGRTHMLVAGPEDAPPLVLMQGMAGSAVLWHLQLADFTRQCRVYALDTIGQPGRSDPNPPSVMDDSYAYWLSDVLDGLGLAQADLIGISIGGYAIIRLGILFPERVRKAVLLSPLRLARAKFTGSRWVGSAMKPDSEEDNLEERLTVRDFNASSGQEKYDRQLARAMALATRHYKLGVALGIPAEASRLEKARVGSGVIRRFASAAPAAELRQFRVPCLVVMGENEALYNTDKAAGRAALMPNARVVIVPEAGHAAVFDRPEVINPIILDFLAEPLPGEV